MKMGQKIREIRLARKLRLAEVENLAGIANGNLSRIERGEQWISEDKLCALADTLGVAVADFFSDGLQKHTLAPFRNLRALPVISAMQAMALIKPGVSYAPEEGDDVVYVNYAISARAFAVRMDDESMLTEFRVGDILVLDPELAPKPGDYVLAKHGKQEALFRKYRSREAVDGGDLVFELAPLNDDFPSLRSDGKRTSVIGVLVEQRKTFGTKS